MENTNFDFNTKLKKISKDLVQSFFNNDISPKNKIINTDKGSSPNLDQNFSYTEIIYHKKNNCPQNTIEKSTNNKNSLANSCNRFLFTEQTTKSSVTNNYFPQKELNELSTTKTITNNEAKKKRFKYSLDFNKTFSSSTTYTNFKAKQESTKEKKLYEEKIKSLRNHINALKKQQSDLARKYLIAKENENNKIKIKKNKESIKQALLSAEIDRRNEFELKRKNIAEKKMKENNGLLISKGRVKKNKTREYKKALNKKQKFEQIMLKDNCKLNEINKTLIEKIKTDRENTKNNLFKKKTDYINRLNNSYRLTHQNNLNETKKLKTQLIKLEKMEEEYLENMKHTREIIKKNNFDNVKIRIGNVKIKSYNNLDKTANISFDMNKRKSNSMEKRYKINDKNDVSRNKKDKISSVPKLKNY